MYFKLEYTIRELSLPKGEEFAFNVTTTPAVQVRIRPPNDAEQKIGHDVRHAFSTAQVNIDPSVKNKKIFEAIEKNIILKPGSEWRTKYTGPDGNEIVLPSVDEFPEYFRSFVDNISKELSNPSMLVINAIRWRINRLGPHQAISTRGLSWSKEQQFWHPVPTSILVRILDSSSTAYLSEKAKKDISHIVNNGFQEPVYHELFREAWGQRNDNPRSSLVTGLSSLEVAIKSTIGNLIGGTSWLVENLPSPPVNRLLNEYLPTLPAVNTINGKVHPPPKNIIELIKKGVTIRNQIAHIGGKAPSDENLDQILEAIHDVIWLLDYYCGHTWAYEFISDETRLSLEVGNGA